MATNTVTKQIVSGIEKGLNELSRNFRCAPNAVGKQNHWVLAAAAAGR